MRKQNTVCFFLSSASHRHCSGQKSVSGVMQLGDCISLAPPLDRNGAIRASVERAGKRRIMTNTEEAASGGQEEEIKGRGET